MKEDFPTICSTLPGYVFIEICFAPENDGLMGKLRWWLRHGEAPELHQMEVPECRTYENIVAIPSTDFLSLNSIDLKPPRKPWPPERKHRLERTGKSFSAIFVRTPVGGATRCECYEPSP